MLEPGELEDKFLRLTRARARRAGRRRALRAAAAPRRRERTWIGSALSRSALGTPEREVQGEGGAKRGLEVRRLRGPQSTDGRAY